jgi:hypothetical protein
MKNLKYMKQKAIKKQFEITYWNICQKNDKKNKKVFEIREINPV